ncbi:hypothetical protein AWENTII_003609 [Aspergillus wentii]
MGAVVFVSFAFGRIAFSCALSFTREALKDLRSKCSPDSLPLSSSFVIPFIPYALFAVIYILCLFAFYNALSRVAILRASSLFYSPLLVFFLLLPFLFLRPVYCFGENDSLLHPSISWHPYIFWMVVNALRRGWGFVAIALQVAIVHLTYTVGVFDSQTIMLHGTVHGALL